MSQNADPPSTTTTPRQYISAHLSPYLQKGMVQVYRAQPDNVLRYLGEFLITQSIRQDSSQNTEITEHFLYDHSEPQNLPSSPVQAPTRSPAPLAEVVSPTEVNLAQGSAANGNMDIKTETDGDVTMGGDDDPVMAEETANQGATEPTQPTSLTG